VYLLHQVIGFDFIWYLEHAGVDNTAAVFITIVGVTLLASALTFLVERPAMRAIRDAWPNRGTLS
jgi:peptidoglycan/LPS O-acetylase OafA/YrhL